MNLFAKRLTRRGCPYRVAKTISMRHVRFTNSTDCRVATTIARQWISEFGIDQSLAFVRFVREMYPRMSLYTAYWSWCRAKGVWVSC